MKKDTLLDILQANRVQIKSFGISLFGIFGSFARNEQTDSSDVDVIIEFEKGKKSYKKFIGLVYYLEDLLKRKVDMLTFQSISPILKEQIEKEVTYVSL
jgi:predicted nucleotidyltransferase